MQFVKISVLWERSREHPGSLHSKYSVVNIQEKEHHINTGNADFPLELSQVQFQFTYFKLFQEVPIITK